MSYFVTDNTQFRFLNKSDNANERENYSQWWCEQIRQYGTSVSYYVSNYTLSARDVLYGEDVISGYAPPVTIVIAGNLIQSLMLGKFGFLSDDQSTFYIHISSFYNAFGWGAEPKSGDVIKLTEYGSDRPGTRDGRMFEITERLDEEVTETNQLMGHYVWKLKCKRFEYSYEPGITPEAGSTQLTLDCDMGILSGGTLSAASVSAIAGNIDQDSKSIFDYPANGNLDHVYGDY